MRSPLTLTAALAAGATLVACGGGSDDGGSVVTPPPPPAAATAVPDSAVASPAALVQYLYTQPASDETSEALTLPAADPATSETDGPVPLV